MSTKFTIRPDSELIEAARRGDATAYDELFRRHESAARRLARLISKHRTDAEDLVLRAYTEVLDVRGTGRIPPSVPTCC